MYDVKYSAIQSAHTDRLHSNHLMSSSPSKLQKHSTHSTHSTTHSVTPLASGAWPVAHSRVLGIAAFAARLRRRPGVPLQTITSWGTPGSLIFEGHVFRDALRELRSLRKNVFYLMNKNINIKRFLESHIRQNRLNTTLSAAAISPNITRSVLRPVTNMVFAHLAQNMVKDVQS